MSSFSLQLQPFSTRVEHTHTHNDSSNNTCIDPFLNSLVSVRFLNYSATTRDLKLAKSLHAGILKSGLGANVYVGNSLLNAYAKCKCLDGALTLFGEMPERNVVSWTSIMSGQCQQGLHVAAVSTFQKMLKGGLLPNEFTLAVMLQVCAQTQDLKLGEAIHSQIIRNGFTRDQFLQNSLIDMYSKSGSLVAAEKLMDRLNYRDVVCWTSLISSCVSQGFIKKALILFFRMQEDGVAPNPLTITSIIQACSLMHEWWSLRWIHCWVIKAKLCGTPFVVNSLLEMYSRNEYVEEVVKIFSQFCLTDDCQYLDPETMAILIQGCAHTLSLELGYGIHGYLIKHGFFPCTLLENSLMNMYAKTKQVDFAHQLFTSMNTRDVISWNTMILCYVKNDRPQDALQLINEIIANGGDSGAPDFVTILSSLQACAGLASLQKGQIMHGYIIKSGFEADVFISNSLIDMYAKSGKIDFARHVFDDMRIKDLTSWNVTIAAYGIHGDGVSALQVLWDLEKYGNHLPNAITFLNILVSCGHSGLIKEGYECFSRMTTDYGVAPGIEHFVCMVNLLGRSGLFKEAEEFIEQMPMKPSSAPWGALLGACALFSNVNVAERVAQRLSVLDQEGKAWRVTLSNIYAGAGRWEDAVRLRVGMKGEGLRKEAGWSSVDVRGESFRFIAGDTRHPMSTTIYETMNSIGEQIRDAASIA